MRKNYFALILIGAALCTPGFAQSVATLTDSLQTKKIGYFFSVQTGALFGDQVTFTSSTIHGVRLGKKFRLGGGVGFDSFEDSQLMPVFGSASLDLFGKKNVVFVQMNYGYAPYAWSPTLKDIYGYKDTKGGETFSTMLGYRISSGNIRVAILAGYRHQELKLNYENRYYYYLYDFASNYIAPGYNQVVSKSLNRFTVSLSVGWK